MRLALALGERRRARHDEADPGHTLEALVGRRHDPVASERPHVERQGPEGAHRVEQQPPATGGDDLGDLADRVQDPGGGLAVHHGHVSDGGISRQRGVHRGRRGRHVLRRLERGVGAPHHLADPRHAGAVGPVDEDQHLARARHEGAERRLHHEGAAALERHRDEVAAARDLHQPPPHPGRHGDERAVARAPVVEHGPLGAVRGGEGARSQEPGVSWSGLSHRFLPGGQPPTRCRPSAAVCSHNR